MTSISEKKKEEYFCGEGLTRVIGLMRLEKLVFPRSRFSPLAGLRCGLTPATPVT
jgi:hypothetical protein